MSGNDTIEAPLLTGAAKRSGALYGAEYAQGVTGGRFQLAAPPPPRPLPDGSVVQNMVCGAGPAGLLTACLLAKEGVSVTVFEMRPRPTSFYGSFPVVLNMRGMTALSKLGNNVLAKFQDLGRTVDELHIVPNNRTVAKTKTYGTCIMRDQAVGLLLEEADRLGVHVHWGHKLLDINIETRVCTFERSVRSDDAGHGAITGSDKNMQGNSSLERVSIQTGTILGCDGNYSKVRRVMESKTELTVDEEDWGVLMRCEFVFFSIF